MGIQELAHDPAIPLPAKPQIVGGREAKSWRTAALDAFATSELHRHGKLNRAIWWALPTALEAPMIWRPATHCPGSDPRRTLGVTTGGPHD